MILENKRQNDTYMRQYVEIFDDIASLRKNLFENFKEELAPAVDLESFHLGYYDEKNRKLTITNNYKQFSTRGSVFLRKRWLGEAMG